MSTERSEQQRQEFSPDPNEYGSFNELMEAEHAKQVCECGCDFNDHDDGECPPRDADELELLYGEPR